MLYLILNSKALQVTSLRSLKQPGISLCQPLIRRTWTSRVSPALMRALLGRQRKTARLMAAGEAHLLVCLKDGHDYHVSAKNRSNLEHPSTESCHSAWH